MRLNLRSARGALLLFALMVGLTGCLSMKAYVDPALPMVTKADVGQVAAPTPVQILFEFRTKGSSNARATEQVKPRIVAVVAESGLFSAVSSTAGNQGGAGVLTITIDNVPLTDNAAAKGFGTGLTFGLAGSTVTDGYTATATYTRDGKTTEVSVKHALHSTIGNASGPPGLKPMDMQSAVNQIMDQLTWNVLKALKDQHAFD